MKPLTDPALQSGTRRGLDNIRGVHSHVETENQGHAYRLHLKGSTKGKTSGEHLNTDVKNTVMGDQ